MVFQLQKQDFKYVHQDLSVSVEAGEFDVMIGSNSEELEIETIYLDFKKK